MRSCVALIHHWQVPGWLVPVWLIGRYLVGWYLFGWLPGTWWPVRRMWTTHQLTSGWCMSVVQMRNHGLTISWTKSSSCYMTRTSPRTLWLSRMCLQLFSVSFSCLLVTGSIARSANLPVFSLLRGQFWGFSPRRGDTLHRWGWNLAWRRGLKVPSSMPNFTPIGAKTRV